MVPRWVWVLFAVGALAGLAACGGGTSGGGSSTVTVTSTGSVPWLAYQNGSGAWHALSGTTFKVTDAGGRYGLAWVCEPSSGAPRVNIVQATTTEATAATAACPTPVTTLYSVSGNLLGMPSGGTGFVSIGDGYEAQIPYSSSAPYSVVVSPGTKTVVAYGTGSPGKILIIRSHTVSGSVTGYDLDLSSASASTFSEDQVTLSNMPSGETSDVYAGLISSGTGLVYLGKTNGGTALSYPVVPAGLAQASDIYLFTGTAASNTATGFTSQRVDRTVQTPSGTVDLPMPPPLSSPAGIGVAAGRATATWGSLTFAQSGGTVVYGASVSPASPSSKAAWSVAITASWLGSNTSYTFPDLSSTAGWNTAWDFPTGVTADAVTTVWHTGQELPEFELFLRNSDYAALPSGITVEQTASGNTGTY